MNDGPRYRRVYVTEWHDPIFRGLNDGGRIVRLYVTAGPQTTSVGCFRLSTAVAHQGSGIQGSGNQRTENRRGSKAGGLRAVASVDERLIQIARQTLRMTNPNAPRDHLLDAFDNVAGSQRVNGYTRTNANDALTIALDDASR